MLTLGWPWLLLLLPLPLLLRALLTPARPTQGLALRLPSLAGLAALTAGPLPARRARLALAALIWALLVLAAARPQWIGAPIALPMSGRDLMLVVDISGSMDLPDYSLAGQPATRLDVVKQTAGRFIERRTQDRIGLILFGTRPYVQTPLTYDRATVAQMLDEAIVGLAGIDTAIGDALGLAVKRLQALPPGQQVIVLLTDGDSNAGALAPLTAAGLAADAGIRIYSIGMGGPVGQDTSAGFRVEQEADDLDPATLRALAERTGGHAFIATDAAQLERVYALLDQLEPNIRTERTWRPTRDYYPWPAAAALLLSLLLALRLAPSGWRWRQRASARAGDAPGSASGPAPIPTASPVSAQTASPTPSAVIALARRPRSTDAP